MGIHCTSAIKTLLNRNDNILQLGTALGYFSSYEKFKMKIVVSMELIKMDDAVENNFKINNFKNYKLYRLNISNKTIDNEITFDLLKYLMI